MSSLAETAYWQSQLAIAMTSCIRRPLPSLPYASAWLLPLAHWPELDAFDANYASEDDDSIECVCLQFPLNHVWYCWCNSNHHLILADLKPVAARGLHIALHGTMHND